MTETSDGDLTVAPTLVSHVGDWSFGVVLSDLSSEVTESSADIAITVEPDCTNYSFDPVSDLTSKTFKINLRESIEVSMSFE
jgi:hypothetical protein